MNMQDIAIQKQVVKKISDVRAKRVRGHSVHCCNTADSNPQPDQLDALRHRLWSGPIPREIENQFQ